MEKIPVIKNCKVVIIGGSAGSLDILIKVLPRVKQVQSFAIVIVLHRKSAEDSTLEELLAAKTIIPVREVEDKTPLLPGYVYVAPSDYHLLFEKDDTLALDTSEKVNYSRPSIDVAFESAAQVYKDALVAIVLSGANADGTAGLNAVKAAGGIIAVQDPDIAEMPFMPNSAMQLTRTKNLLTPDELIHFINGINT